MSVREDERAPDDEPVRASAPSSRAKTIAGRFGIGAFAFFLIKGLLWLVGPALVAWWASR